MFYYHGMQELYTHLKQYGKVKLNEPLAKHTTFKIGGPAQFFVTVDETDTLISLLKFLDSEGTPYVILGGGSNTLARDEAFDGVVVAIRNRKLEIDGDVVVADAGCVTVAVSQASMRAGLTGFEWGVGVPGTIGGAVRGNAGAMGGDIQKDVLKVQAYRDGEVIQLTNEECQFGYRDSTFKREGGVVLRVYLQLEKATPDSVLMKKALEHLQYRNSTQPQGFASSGCIFKNVDIGQQTTDNRQQTVAKKNRQLLMQHVSDDNEKVKRFLEIGKISAGWLIEQAGLKGRRVGNVEISEKHGNFLVNLGGATAEEVRMLIEEVKQEVYTRFGIELEEEVVIF